MLQITVENQYGQQLKINNNVYYQLVGISGITPPVANINTSELATKDGSLFNSSFLQNRNIVLTLQPINNVEQARLNLYTYFKVKRYVKLYFKTSSRNVWIEGYVESMDIDVNANPQLIQVSVICPDPYFKSMDTVSTEFSYVTGELEFPVDILAAGIEFSSFSAYTQEDIYNPSDEEVGIVIDVHASDAAEDLTIVDVTSNETFTIEYTFEEGDDIQINTQRGEKAVTLTRDGTTINLINYMTSGSTWFTLQPGDNIFSYTATSGAANLLVTITVQPIYEGV